MPYLILFLSFPFLPFPSLPFPSLPFPFLSFPFLSLSLSLCFSFSPYYWDLELTAVITAFLSLYRICWLDYLLNTSFSLSLGISSETLKSFFLFPENTVWLVPVTCLSSCWVLAGFLNSAGTWEGWSWSQNTTQAVGTKI